MDGYRLARMSNTVPDSPAAALAPLKTRLPPARASPGSQTNVGQNMGALP